jgi:rhodanese-related sulfurtransferase
MGFFSKLFGGSKVDYRELVKQGAIIVDVRTPQEFKSGHLKGSKNIPLQTLSNSISKLKGKEVVLVCRSGGRAGSAKGILSSHGITAHNAGAWQNLR